MKFSTCVAGLVFALSTRLDERLREYPFASTRLYQSQVALSPFGDKMFWPVIWAICLMYIPCRSRRSRQRGVIGSRIRMKWW